jgi:hypothetical protein
MMTSVDDPFIPDTSFFPCFFLSLFIYNSIPPQTLLSTLVRISSRFLFNSNPPLGPLRVQLAPVVPLTLNNLHKNLTLHRRQT